MSSVDVTMEVSIPEVEAAEIEAAVLATLSAEGADLDLSLVLVDDKTIHGINRQFLEHDYPTDVITFDLRDEGPGSDGEIVVSVETARRESEVRKVTLKSEVLLYCVHGTLHLLGFDDHEPEDRKQMHQRQIEILAQIGHETTE